MGCHFCSDELFAILGILGAVKYLPSWIKVRWAARHQAANCRSADHDHQTDEEE